MSKANLPQHMTASYEGINPVKELAGSTAIANPLSSGVSSTCKVTQRAN